MPLRSLFTKGFERIMTFFSHTIDYRVTQYQTIRIRFLEGICLSRWFDRKKYAGRRISIGEIDACEKKCGFVGNGRCGGIDRLHGR